MIGKKQSWEYAKDILLKNNWVLSFSIITFLCLLMSIFNLFNIVPMTFLGKYIFLFPTTIFFLLTIGFLISSILAYYGKLKWIFVPLIVWLLIATFSIRTSNVDGLVNAATGEPVLGPDLDPYLFMRLATDIVGEGLKNPDMMRGYPIGVENYAYTNLEAWMISFIYKVVNIFNSSFTIIQAGIYSTPVWFTLSVIPLFLMLFYLFSFTISKKKAAIGAGIGSFLYAMSPVLLARSVAGIPESEGHAFLWFFMAFLFFVLAWKQDYANKKEKKKLMIFSLLSGLFASVMAWTWGGHSYIYMVVGLTAFLLFLFEKEKIKNFVILGLMMLVSFVFILLRNMVGGQGMFGGMMNMLTNMTGTGIAFAVLGLLLVDFLIFRIGISKKLNKVLKKFKLPENITSILIVLILGLIFLLITNPTYVFSLIGRIFEMLITPFGAGRFGETVAEHRLPYYSEVIGNFGYLFWIFLFSVILIFYEAFKKFKIKQKTILNVSFIVFVLSFMFSRISPEHTLNGVNFISKLFYFGGMFIFGGSLLLIIIKAYRNKDERTLEDFKNIHFSYIFLISCSILAIFSLRVAIRFFLMASILMIPVVSYLPLRLWARAKRTNDDLGKFFLWVVFGLIILALFSIGIANTQQIQYQAQYTVPSPYNQQWHYAMNWVDENTAEDAVFSHWWDYGYWVQTLGKRATLADGGHWAGAPAHFIGRYILTTSNPDTALSMWKTLGVDYLLIDSTDVGKYSAFSSIASDKTGKDRRSWIPVMPVDERQTQETAEGIIKIYSGGSYVDEDILYESDEGQIFLPESKAAIGGIIFEYNIEEDKIIFKKLTGAFFYNNKQENLPIRYIYLNGQLVDLGYGINATIRIIPSLEETSQGMRINELGAAMYLSNKVMNTLFSELYLMNDPYNKYPTIKLAHSEDDYVVKIMKQQGAFAGEFLYYRGFRGPIKIWNTTDIPEDVPFHAGFLERDFGEKDYGKLDYLFE